MSSSIRDIDTANIIIPATSLVLLVIGLIAFGWSGWWLVVVAAVLVAVAWYLREKVGGNYFGGDRPFQVATAIITAIALAITLIYLLELPIAVGTAVGVVLVAISVLLLYRIPHLFGLAILIALGFMLILWFLSWVMDQNKPEVPVIHLTVASTSGENLPIDGVTGHLVAEGVEPVLSDTADDSGQLTLRGWESVSWESGQFAGLVIKDPSQHWQPRLIRLIYRQGQGLIPIDSSGKVLVSEVHLYADEAPWESYDEAVWLVDQCQTQACAEMMAKVWAIVIRDDSSTTVSCTHGSLPAGDSQRLVRDSRGSLISVGYHHDPYPSPGWKCAVEGETVYVLEEGGVVATVIQE